MIYVTAVTFVNQTLLNIKNNKSCQIMKLKYIKFRSEFAMKIIKK